MSTLGKLLHGIADDCDRVCGQDNSMELAELQRQQQQAREDIDLLMDSVAALSKKVQGGSGSGKIIKMDRRG